MLDGSPFPNLLSAFVYTRTYARWMEELARRETWPETVERYVDFVFRGRDVPGYELWPSTRPGANHICPLRGAHCGAGAFHHPHGSRN